MNKRIDFYSKPIMLIIDRNPKKPGSMAHDRFKHYFSLPSTATVADALKVGIRMDDIRHDSEHGYIAVGADAIEFHVTELEREREQRIADARKLIAEIDSE